MPVDAARDAAERLTPATRRRWPVTSCASTVRPSLRHRLVAHLRIRPSSAASFLSSSDALGRGGSRPVRSLRAIAWWRSRGAILDSPQFSVSTLLGPHTAWAPNIGCLASPRAHPAPLCPGRHPRTVQRFSPIRLMGSNLPGIRHSVN